MLVKIIETSLQTCSKEGKSYEQFYFSINILCINEGNIIIITKYHVVFKI